MKRWEKMILAIALGLLVGISISIFMAGTAKCWGCYGGPCVTSAACVEGCHCIGDPGRCG
jgi:hypothetical protein